VNCPRASTAALLPLLLGAVGCISKPTTGPQIFSIDPPPLVHTQASPGGYMVAVDRVEVAPQFAGRALTYRTGPHSFEKDPYAVLAASPRELVLGLVRFSLANADFVRAVVEQGGPQPADLLVEAYVSDLEGDFTVPDKPVAVVGMEMVVMSVPALPQPVATVLRRAYLRRLPLPERTAAAVANAWNEGLTSIVREFVEDMRGALSSASAAPAPRR